MSAGEDAGYEGDAACRAAYEMETPTPKQLRREIVGREPLLLGQVLERAVFVFAVAVPAARCGRISWAPEG